MDAARLDRLPAVKRHGRRQHLVIMVREPRMGRGKTRLARDIGSVGAARAYRLIVSGLIERLAGQRDWQTHLAIAPPVIRSVDVFADRRLPVRHEHGPSFFMQHGASLGERIAHGLNAPGRGPVVMIGSDCPDIRRPDIVRAFKALASAKYVLGPSHDGGFWLIGARSGRAIQRCDLNGVRWSSASAYADTAQRLERIGGGGNIARLHSIEDCDDGQSYSRLQPVIGRRVYPRHGRSGGRTI